MSPQASIPELLARVIARSGADQCPSPQRTALTQTGEMWRTPGARPLRFTATQWLDPTRCDFAWNARFPMVPGVALHVTDAFEDGVGRLEGRLWGWLQLFRQRGPEVDRGEVFRYLAELPWVPAAYTANPTLSWEQTGPDTLRVTHELASRPLRLDLTVDADGHVTGIRAEDRPYEQKGTFIERPWVGRYGGWTQFGALTVPTTAEVGWETPDGPFIYFRGRVTSHSTEHNA